MDKERKELLEVFSDGMEVRMDKITAAIGLIKEASREMEKNGFTLRWKLWIEPYVDLLTPMLAESKPQTALPPQESAGTE